MFKFTIRELMLVTVIVAVAAGWWARERQLQATIDECGAYKMEALIWHSRAEQLAGVARDSGWAVDLDDGVYVQKPGEQWMYYRWEKAARPVGYNPPSATRQGP